MSRNIAAIEAVALGNATREIFDQVVNGGVVFQHPGALDALEVGMRGRLFQSPELAEVARRQMEIREETGRLQKELTEKIFAEVKGKLERYMGTGDYERHLIAQVRAAKEFAGDDEIQIYIDPADIDKKNSIAAAANTTVMVSKYGFGGGIRAVIRSRGILIDQSFETKVKEAAEGFVFHL